MIEQSLEAALGCGELRRFDLQMARHIGRLNGTASDALTLATALVSNRLGAGDICVSLHHCQHFGLFTNSDITPPLAVPESDQWRDELMAQSVVGRAGDYAPLILTDDNLLYLGRYWQLEHSLATRLGELASSEAPPVKRDLLRDGLNRVFAESHNDIDWQKVAAANAVCSKLSIITGGPGTGKTYTVAALLVLLAEQWQQCQQTASGELRIALAAPTGKAAARLTGAVADAAHKLAADTDIADYLKLEAQTLHALLRVHPDRVQPYHHAGNPLPVDVLIIDEASMIDLPLMSKTFAALADEARVVLLGDQNQLSSVESGMVLGDICGGHSQVNFSAPVAESLGGLCGFSVPSVQQSVPPVASRIVYLQHSRRTRDSGGISALASAVNAGDSSRVLAVLRNPDHANVELVEGGDESIEEVLHQHLVPGFAALLRAPDPQQALLQLDKTCVLCALRGGPSGVTGINRRMQRLLQPPGLAAGNDGWYPGLPLMISRNSPAHRLANGDRGVVLESSWQSAASESAAGQLRVYFDGADGVRSFSPQRLPAHERFYATTIHKSQGSEYDTVVIVLPEQDNPVLSRELLYTAVTRAKRHVVVVASAEQLHSCVQRRVQRQSGLRRALWGEGSAPVDDRPARSAPATTQQALKPQQQSFDF